MVKNAKKIMGLLCVLIFCTVIAIGMPQIVQAAETETFTGASGKSGDLEWNITPEGHLTVEGEGDYGTISIDEIAINGPDWLEYRKYIRTAKISVKDITSTMYMVA